MTIRIPRKSVGDRVLKALGKKREIRIRSEPYEKFGRYAYAKATKESFWRAIFRPGNAQLPNGMIDIDELIETNSSR